MFRCITSTLLVLGLVFGFARVTEADTILLKSGVKIEGEVISQDESTVRILIGGQEREYKATAIAKVEENENTGHFDPAAEIEKAKARVAKLDRETGLTAVQRKEVKALMSDLQSTDEDIHDDAKRALIAFHKDTSLLKYFEWWLPGLSPRFVPGVLEILGEIDPDRAAQIAPSHLTDLDPRSRAMALTVLSKAASQDQLKLLGRGMVDPSYEVRIAAARAIGTHKLKAATPLLIDEFETGEPHLANVVRNALRDTWSTESRPVEFDTKAEWEAYWVKQRSSVAEPMIAMAMRPFVQPGEVYEDE